MEIRREINVQDFIDSRRLSRMQVAVLLLSFCVVAVDGFDTALIAFIAPALGAEWHLTAGDISSLFGAGLAGLMVGALLFGPLADRYGRKNVLLACVAIFGAACLACTSAESLRSLAFLRFVTGIGLGGAMPMAVTLSSEYSPRRHRSVLVTAMFCGLTLGSGLGGVLAAHIVNEWGWRAVLALGGVLPLLLLPLLMWALPESATYLVSRGGNPGRAQRILSRIAPDEDLVAVTWTVPPTPAGSPVRQLFAPELRRGTMLIWLTFFMSLLVIYLLSNWLPTVIKSTGMTLLEASVVTAMFQVGGTVGAITLGQMMDRLQASKVLATAYLLAAVFAVLIGISLGEQGSVDARGLRRRILRVRWTGRSERPRGCVLPDLQSRHWCRLGIRRRPGRLSRRWRRGRLDARPRHRISDHVRGRGDSCAHCQLQLDGNG